jgi:hypothetical protein
MSHFIVLAQVTDGMAAKCRHRTGSRQGSSRPRRPTGSLAVLSDPAAIPLFTRFLNHLAGSIRQRRSQPPRWRRLNPHAEPYSPGPPAQPRHRHPPGGGFEIGQLAYAILDATLIPIDRVADQWPYYSSKHKRHGVNMQVIADTAGRLVWASAAPLGSTHDLTARPAPTTSSPR